MGGLYGWRRMESECCFERMKLKEEGSGGSGKDGRNGGGGGGRGGGGRRICERWNG